MTREEYRKRLGQLRESLNRGLFYHAVWKSLLLHDESTVHWSIEDRNNVMGRFKGFFTPVGSALLDMALMEFAKMFDTDQRTASLANLLKAAQRDSRLVPHISPGELSKISVQIKKSKSLLNALKLMRNTRLAHLDADPAPVAPMLTRDVDELAECVKSAFNRLSVGHDNNGFTSWEFQLRQSEQQTTKVLDILLKDMERTQYEHEEDMVRIGVEHVRRTEAEIGIRLNTEDRRSAIHSLGFSEEQVKRVENAYTSGNGESGSS